MIKRITITFLFALLFRTAFSQLSGFSLTSGLDVQRNFKKEQRYWAVGVMLQGIFHFTPKEGMYLSFGWYSNGRFSNNVTATAKSILTIPQKVNYTNSARMAARQFSAGYRRYLKGVAGAEMEERWNLYAYAGFGLLLGTVENTQSVSPDTTTYAVPVFNGRAGFKRLTFDVGAGYEVPLGADFYIYAEGRVWIPASGYPSRFILKNDNAPFMGILGVGVRVLF